MNAYACAATIKKDHPDSIEVTTTLGLREAPTPEVAREEFTALVLAANPGWEILAEAVVTRIGGPLTRKIMIAEQEES